MPGMIGSSGCASIGLSAAFSDDASDILSLIVENVSLLVNPILVGV